MKIVLAGGSGSLGRRLAADLSTRGHEVVILTRSPLSSSPSRQVAWDGATVGPWAPELEGAAIINLAGALVDRRPTPANVELLTRSRVEPIRALDFAAATLTTPPAVWIQASTLAIYGDKGKPSSTSRLHRRTVLPRWRVWLGPGRPPPLRSPLGARSSCARASCSTAAPRRWTA